MRCVENRWIWKACQSEDIQYLLHELQVHQAELSIQNEELRRVQLDLETRGICIPIYTTLPRPGTARSARKVVF